MHLHELKPEEGSKRKKVRVGRGIGSGLGKTCGRGTKGQSARRQIHPRFEGGQTPIHRRLPVKKGFRNPNSIEYAVLNLSALEEVFESGSEVNIDTVRAKGLVGNLKDGLKILGQGELTKKLKITAQAFSKAAEAKIQKAGGEVTKL
ncbi:MAG TPA: 50S ribosomal protein L15 [Fimbriimonadales bacterium]|jgi:large subunit ribosomal protein L15|nr:50S ribosomal protein L15 [Fimbriimonadales bacterium]